MGQILDLSGCEAMFVELSPKRWLARTGDRVPTAKEQARFHWQSAQALRWWSSASWVKTCAG